LDDHQKEKISLGAKKKVLHTLLGLLYAKKAGCTCTVCKNNHQLVCLALHICTRGCQCAPIMSTFSDHDWNFIPVSCCCGIRPNFWYGQSSEVKRVLCDTFPICAAGFSRYQKDWVSSQHTHTSTSTMSCADDVHVRHFFQHYPGPLWGLSMTSGSPDLSWR
jgi:hypothetical protein